MGRLEYLEVENFKSYAGKQIVGPFSDFTCVIGPNGAGKSNLMDAVSFVLGIGARQLRGSVLKDLIYRKDSTSPPARKASVTLVYHDDDNQEIRFSRSISASGVSSYKLGSKDVTYEAYEEVLQKIGVLVKVRNFLVFQGDVEAVASKSPLELTRMFEHISGSEAYATDYDAVLQQREVAEEKALFALQKKKMFSSQRKEIKEQRDEAYVFTDKKTQLSNLHAQHMLWKIFHIKNEMEQCDEEIASKNNQLHVAMTNEQEAKNSVENVKKDVARANKTLIASEKELMSVQKKVSEIGPVRDATKSKCSKISKKVEELIKSRHLVEIDVKTQQETIVKVNAELVLLTTQESSIRSQLASVMTSLTTEQLQEYSKLKEVAATKVSALVFEEKALEMKARSAKTELEVSNAGLSSIQTENTLDEGLVNDTQARIARLEQILTSVRNEEGVLKIQVTDTTKRVKEYEKNETTLSTQLEEVQTRLQEAGDDRRRSKQEERLAEAVKTMVKIFPGVRGRLGDLCRPIQRKYQLALSVAGGKSMDALVVDTRETAADCIRYLRDQRAGTLIFLPLDNLVSAPPAERLRSLGDRYKLCIDLVECDDVLRPAVLYAVGQAIICDSLEDAQELCFNRGERVKAVTLQGHVIGRAGQMTGGNLGQSSNRWEEREMDDLRTRRTDLEESLATIKRDRVLATNDLLSFEVELRRVVSILNSTKADLEAAKKRKDHSSQQASLKAKTASKLKDKVDALQKTLDDVERQLESVRSRIAAQQDLIFAPFCASVGINSIRELEQSHSAHQEFMHKLQELSEQRASLQAQLAYEERRDFASVRTKMDAELSKLERELQDKTAEVQHIETTREALNVKVDSVQATLVTLKEQKRKELERVRAASSLLATTSAELDSLRKLISGIELSLERHRVHLHETLRMAAIEEIKLPTVISDDESQVSGSDASLRWEGSLRSEDAVGSQASSVHFSRGSDAVVTRDTRRAAFVDLSSVRAQVSGQGGRRVMTQAQQTAVVEELATCIAKLIADLETMQPNMHAVERFESVEEKLREATAELDTAREEAAGLMTAFEKVRRERVAVFQECFSHVSESLGVIYRDLTRSSKHPLGGNAYLTLDNTEEPYLGGIRYTAMPPMKRFRDMEQLSGGEKTMAALSLLFSIHSFRQAPFFVLDEVDAALDNVNVKKICNYIKQRSRDFQCVVISLKDIFFEHADNLVGIYRDVDLLSSKILTLDLTRFGDDTTEEAGGGEGAKITTAVDTSRSDISVRSRASASNADSYARSNLSRDVTESQ